MRTVTIVTFKGCESTMNFRDLAETLIDEGKIDARIEMVLTPSANRALELGLYGSPTILIDGQEVQRERRGPAGFYRRAYATAVCYRPYPTAEQLIALFRGERMPMPAMPQVPERRYPILVTAPWCPYTVPATRFWQEAARACNEELEVVNAESDEG